MSWNVSPLAASYFKNGADVTAQREHLARRDRVPARSTSGPAYRVEAVDTATHWPAVYLADAHIPIARGWFRQDDFPQNEVLYGKLGGAGVPGWLHGLGVKYVVLSDATPDYSARGEARLLRERALRADGRCSARAALTIFEVPNARPIITGPARRGSRR